MSKSVTELQKRRNELRGILGPLAEKPKLDAEDRAKWNKYKSEVDELDRDLSLAYQSLEIRAIQNARSNPDKDLSRYSIRRAIELLSQRKPLDGIELEMHQEGEREHQKLGLKKQGGPLSFIVPSRIGYKPMSRASSGQNVTTAADGGNIVGESPLLFLEGLRNAIMLPGMGASFLTGLTGDLPISIGDLFSAAWLAEDGEASVTKMTFGKKSLKPKRLQAVGALSRQLIAQSSADAIVERAIITAIAEAIQLAAINGSGVDPEPLGLLGTEGIGEVVGGTNGAAPNWAHVLELESKVLAANALINPGSASYLFNSLVRSKLKATFKNSTYGEVPMLERGHAPGISELNGYSAYTTNAVPSTLTKGSASGICSAIIFGVWEQLFIGSWGGYEILVDPFTLSDRAEVKTTVITYANSGVGHPQSFAAFTDVLTE